LLTTLYGAIVEIFSVFFAPSRFATESAMKGYCGNRDLHSEF